MLKSTFSNRRQFVQGMAFGAAAWATPGLFAEQLERTARQTEGPFYPNKLPLDTDNDLLIVNDSITSAVGDITHLSGRILGLSGEPIRNAVVEIWQVDHNGVYIHTDSADQNKRDGNFQGFGRFLTNAAGDYYFRTIKPVMYGPRTPHIHMIVKKGDQRLLTTQLYVKGEPRNEKDFLFRAIEDRKARETILVDFAPIEDSKLNELQAKCDIVVGLTPEDPEV